MENVIFCTVKISRRKRGESPKIVKNIYFIRFELIFLFCVLLSSDMCDLLNGNIVRKESQPNS